MGLTLETDIVVEETLDNVLAIVQVAAGLVGQGTGTKSNGDHGHDGLEALVLGRGAKNQLLHALVGVAGREVALVHGTTATLDAGPLDVVTTSQRAVPVGDLLGEEEAISLAGEQTKLDPSWVLTWAES